MKFNRNFNFIIVTPPLACSQHSVAATTIDGQAGGRSKQQLRYYLQTTTLQDFDYKMQ